MTKSNATVEAPANGKTFTPALAWVNPMRRADGSRVADGAYTLTVTPELLAMPVGTRLAVFSVKESFVVKPPKAQ